MFRKIKDMLFPIIITIIAILLMVWWVTPVKAHETGIWKDSNRTGLIVKQEPCGMGYHVFTRPDGTTQPVLMAGHFHLFKPDLEIKTCNELFDYLAAGMLPDTGPGPVMTYNHPADQEGK